jgi:DNA-binding NarL/FixJ family response regulator
VENRIAERSAACHDEAVTTVLIVDDHPSFRASARAMLEAGGFDVIGEAADGVHAIEAASELKPDVVLLDIQLPDFDGFEVATRLSASNNGPAIVLTSSRDCVDFGRLVGTCGARGFIAKADLSGEAISLLL